MSTTDDEAAALELTAAERGPAAGVATEWLRWWDDRAPRTDPVGVDVDRQPAAWDDHRLEHSFAARATGLASTDLRAVEYDGGRLDWWSLDATEPIDEASSAAAPVTLTLRGIPAAAASAECPRRGSGRWRTRGSTSGRSTRPPTIWAG